MLKVVIGLVLLAHGIGHSMGLLQVRMDASLLDGDAHGRVAVITSPARDPELPGLIAQAYGLSAREREVTGLVLHGHSTHEIAGALQVTPYTVQDHLKSNFQKVGVRSRRELVAQLFLQHCAPRLAVGLAPGADGGSSMGNVSLEPNRPDPRNGATAAVAP